jgi:hypothetical protein
LAARFADTSTVLLSSRPEIETRNASPDVYTNNNNPDGQQSPPRKNTRSYSTTNRTVVSRNNSATRYNGRDFNNNNNNNNNNFRRQPPRANNKSGSNDQFGSGGADGNSFGPSLKLENPKKLARIVNEVPGSNSDLFDDVPAGQSSRQQRPSENGQQQPNRRRASISDDNNNNNRRRPEQNRDSNAPRTKVQTDKNGGEFSNQNLTVERLDILLMVLILVTASLTLFVFMDDCSDICLIFLL